MKKLVGILVVTLLIIASSSFSLTTLADWELGDGHKMHYPQLPDPFGWDVDATYVESVWPQNCLADDWMCSESGPVTDIHFWGSWLNDQVGTIVAFSIAIAADIPADPPSFHSRPGITLWERTLYPDDWVVAGPWEGPQGWYDPGEGFYVPENHFLYWQYNIEDIENPFIQEEGTIYWLSISAIVALDSPQPRWGWKSSLIHWNDDAVHGFWYELDWVELLEPPGFETSLDLAFVITGEDGPVNHPPNTPSKPSGPTSVTEGVQYNYTISTTDPDGDNVKYGLDFDNDGVVDPGHWTGFYPSGAPITVKITFYGASTRYMRTIAEDVYGAQSGFSSALTIVVSGANNLPLIPDEPSGPTSGNVGVTYTYTTKTTDPDGDNIRYGWDWDGNNVIDEWTSYYPSGATISTSHSWSTASTYNVKVKAEDSNGAQSGFSTALTIVITSKNPPTTPAVAGPTSGKTGTSYTYSATSTDPDGHHIFYWFDWGDGTNTGWMGPYFSGQTANTAHAWSLTGTYTVKVKAKDDPDGNGDCSDGMESSWGTLTISMPKNKAINTPFLNFFENHPHLFPLLRQLLGLQ